MPKDTRNNIKKKIKKNSQKKITRKVTSVSRRMRTPSANKEAISVLLQKICDCAAKRGYRRKRTKIHPPRAGKKKTSGSLVFKTPPTRVKTPAKYTADILPRSNIPLQDEVKLFPIPKPDNKSQLTNTFEQAIQNETLLQAIQNENLAQAIHKENLAPAIHKENLLQEIQKETLSQETQKETLSQETQNEILSQATQKEASSQATQKETLSQPTEKENLSQETQKEISSQSTEKENPSLATNDSQQTKSLIDPSDEVILRSLLHELPDQLEKSKQFEEYKSAIQDLSERVKKLHLNKSTAEMVESFFKEQLRQTEESVVEECAKDQLTMREESFKEKSSHQEEAICGGPVPVHELPPSSEMPMPEIKLQVQLPFVTIQQEDIAKQELNKYPVDPTQQEILKQQELLWQQQLVLKKQQSKLMKQHKQLQQEIHNIQQKQVAYQSPTSRADGSTRHPVGKKKAQQLTCEIEWHEEKIRMNENQSQKSQLSRSQLPRGIIEHQRELSKSCGRCKLHDENDDENNDIEKNNHENTNQIQNETLKSKSTKTEDPTEPILNTDNVKRENDNQDTNKDNEAKDNSTNINKDNKTSVNKMNISTERSVSRNYAPIKYRRQVKHHSNDGTRNDDDAKKFEDNDLKKTIKSQTQNTNNFSKNSTNNNIAQDKSKKNNSTASDSSSSKKPLLFRKYNKDSSNIHTLNTNTKINKTVLKTNNTIIKTKKTSAKNTTIRKDSNRIVEFLNSYLSFIYNNNNNNTKPERKNSNNKKVTTMKKSETMFDNHAPDYNDPTVKLNVYGLTSLNRYLTFTGIGIYHSGVEVYGCEFAFGGYPEPVASIFRMKKPKDLESLSDINGRFTFEQSIVIGKTDMKPAQINSLIKQLGEKEWIGTNYHLIYKNCNNFSAEFVRLLTGKTIPDWVNRVASVLVKFPYLVNQIPQEYVMPAALKNKIKREQAIKYTLSREREEVKGKSSTNKKKALEQQQQQQQPQKTPQPVAEKMTPETAVNTESFYTAATSAIKAMPTKATDDPVLQDLESEQETVFKVPTPPVEDDQPQISTRSLRLKIPQTPKPQDLQDNKSRKTKKRENEEDEKQTTMTIKVINAGQQAKKSEIFDNNEAQKEKVGKKEGSARQTLVKGAESNVQDEKMQLKMKSLLEKKEASYSHSRHKIRIRKKNRLPAAKRNLTRPQPSILKGTFKMVDFNKNVLAVPKSIPKLKANRVLKPGENSIFPVDMYGASTYQSASSLSKHASLPSDLFKSDNPGEKSLRRSKVVYFSMAKSIDENTKNKEEKSACNSNIESRLSVIGKEVSNTIIKVQDKSTLYKSKISEVSVTQTEEDNKEVPKAAKVIEVNEKYQLSEAVKSFNLQIPKIPTELLLAQKKVILSSIKDGPSYSTSGTVLVRVRSARNRAKDNPVERASEVGNTDSKLILNSKNREN